MSTKRLAFKVYAGNMLCGGLIVTPLLHTHTFYPAATSGIDRTYNNTPVSRVAKYKGLRLVRMW